MTIAATSTWTIAIKRLATPDKLESIHSMDQQTMLFGPQRRLLLLEQLGANFSSQAGLLVIQAM